MQTMRVPLERRFLVVEDDSFVARAHVRALRKYTDVVVAPTAQLAMEKLARDDGFSGLIVDVRLPDASGFEVAEYARQRWAMLPVLVVTGDNSRATVNRAFKIGAAMLCKPIHPEDLQAFVTSTLAGVTRSYSAGKDTMRRFAARWQLTPQEMRILEHACEGTPRAMMAASLEISENTLKWHVRSLLRKSGSGARNLRDVARQVLGDELKASAARRLADADAG